MLCRLWCVLLGLSEPQQTQIQGEEYEPLSLDGEMEML